MEKLKMLKENLLATVQAEVAKGLDKANAQELGEAIDMIKDLEETIYYCAITKAMEEKEKENEYMKKYPPMYYSPMMYNSSNGNNRNYDGGSYNYNQSNGGGGSRNYNGDYSYYDGGTNRNYDASAKGNNARGGGTRGYSEMGFHEYPLEIRDYREGKSPLTRRNYMESKELKHDKAKQMQELDKYVQELTEDILEMIHDATPEEKVALSQKMTTLANKIR